MACVTFLKITLEEAGVDMANGRWLLFTVTRTDATEANVTADGERCDKMHCKSKQTRVSIPQPESDRHRCLQTIQADWS